MRLEDYMSTEEPQCETENEDSAVVHYIVKPLRWESSRLTKRKEKLDDAYKERQSARSRKRAYKRVQGASSISAPMLRGLPSMGM